MSVSPWGSCLADSKPIARGQQCGELPCKGTVPGPDYPISLPERPCCNVLEYSIAQKIRYTLPGQPGIRFGRIGPDHAPSQRIPLQSIDAVGNLTSLLVFIKSVDPDDKWIPCPPSSTKSVLNLRRQGSCWTSCLHLTLRLWHTLHFLYANGPSILEYR